MDDAQRALILAGAGYTTGVAGAIAPRLMARAFGIRDVSGEFESTLRMMSFRNIALAQVVTMVGDNERLRKRFFAIGAAMFAADTVFTVVSAASGKVSRKTALMLAGTTGALAAVAAAGAVS